MLWSKASSYLTNHSKDRTVSELRLCGLYYDCKVIKLRQRLSIPTLQDNI